MSLLATAFGVVLVALGVRWCRTSQVPISASNAVVFVVVGATFVAYLVPGASNSVFLGAITVGLGLALVTRATRLDRGMPARFGLPLVAAVGTSMAMAGRDLVVGADVRIVTAPAATAVLLYLLIRGIQRTDIQRELVAGAMMVFLGAALLAGAAQGSAFAECQVQFDKCGPAGALLAGVFPSENTLGYYAALTLLLTGTCAGSRSSRPAQAMLLAVIVFSGSRTSAFALVIAVLIGCGLARASRRSLGARGTEWRRIGAGASAAVVSCFAFIGLYLAARSRGASFSNRGHLWEEIQLHTSFTSLLGLGRSPYEDLLDAGLLRGHYPHSQYVLLATFGGLVAVASFALLAHGLLRAARGRTRRELRRVLAPPVFVLFYGLLEVAWNPLGVGPDLLPLMVVFAAVAAPSTSQRPGAERPARPPAVVVAA